MADESNILLPDNDPDLILAKEIGKRLQANQDLSGLNDELTDLLHSHKKTEEKEIRSPGESLSLNWSRIEEQIASGKSAKTTPFYQRASFRAWAAAAVILIVVFTGIYFLNQPAEEFIAQSRVNIEQVVLPDGSEVTLRPHSKITKTGSGRRYILEGEAFFSVVHDTVHPFSVEAGNATIRVLGTRFNASSWGTRTRVYLEEGSVEFRKTGSEEAVILEPGQAASLNENQLSTPAHASALIYTDWINNTLVLDNSSFREVFNEIEHHYNIAIQPADPDFRTEGIQGTYRLGSLDSTLNDIGLLLGGTFERNPEGVYIFSTH